MTSLPSTNLGSARITLLLITSGKGNGFTRHHLYHPQPVRINSLKPNESSNFSSFPRFRELSDPRRSPGLRPADYSAGTNRIFFSQKRKACRRETERHVTPRLSRFPCCCGLNNCELKVANQRSYLGPILEEGPASRYAHVRQCNVV